MPRNSQYTYHYLAMTANPNTRYTLATYIRYTLRGAARTLYSGDYERALRNSLNRLVAKGEVELTASVRGGDAYVYSNPDFPKNGRHIQLGTPHKTRKHWKGETIVTYPPILKLHSQLGAEGFELVDNPGMAEDLVAQRRIVGFYRRNGQYYALVADGVLRRLSEAKGGE
jgi:hypothetical protein